jgi:surface polysaccharide O-acyltransferase-like enzyme
VAFFCPGRADFLGTFPHFGPPAAASAAAPMAPLMGGARVVDPRPYVGARRATFCRSGVVEALGGPKQDVMRHCILTWLVKDTKLRRIAVGLVMALEKEGTGSRTLYIDLLRTAATFGVIILHVSASKWYDTPVKSFNWQVMNIYDSLVRWTVPIFVMISGVFHLAPNKNGVSFKDEMNIIFKKVLRIGCAITFWGLAYNFINTLGKYIINKEPFTVFGVIKTFGVIVFGPAWYHLWFLYMLMGLYLMTPVLRCFIKNCGREHIEYLLVLFFIVGTCIPFMNGLLNRFPLFKGRAIYFPAAELTGYIGYYTAGYYFANYRIKNKAEICFYVLAVLSALFTASATAFVSIQKNEPMGGLYGYFLPNTMFAAYGVFLFFQRIFRGKDFPAKIEKIIVKISKDTFGIYLIHALVIQVFGIIGINTIIITPVIAIPVISLMVIILSEIGTIIMGKIPTVNKYII